MKTLLALTLQPCPQLFRSLPPKRRVVIETKDWNMACAMSLAGIKPVPEKFDVKWKAEPRFSNEFTAPAVKDPARETSVTLAQGLPNRRHTLEISGGGATAIAAIRVSRPPLAMKQSR